MRRESALPLMTLLAAVSSIFPLGLARAQEIPPKEANAGVLMPDSVRGVTELIAPTVPALLSASISAAEKGTQYKIAFSPAEAFDLEYTPGVTEASVQLLSDSSNSLTRLSVSSGYNPFLVRGPRATAISEHVKQMLPCVAEAETAADQCETSCSADAEAATSACNAQCSTSGQSQCQDSCAATALTTLCKLDCSPGIQEQKKTCLGKCSENLSKQRKACIARRAAAEWGELNSSWAPAVTATAFADFFPFGREPSKADPTVEAGTKPFGGGGGQLSVTFRAMERVQVDGWASLRRGRTSGKPESKLATYKGGGLTVSALVCLFLSKPELLESQDYVRQGFIPGLGVGVSGQLNECSVGIDCDKNRTSQKSITPFMDVRATSKLQFRLGIPVTVFTAVDSKTGTDVAPTLTLAGQIGAL